MALTLSSSHDLAPLGRSEVRAQVAAETYETAAQLAADCFGVKRDARWRRPARLPGALGQARRTALYLAVVVRGLSLRPVAEAASLSPESVRHAVRKVEDWRDDADFDRLLDQLEQEMGA